MNEHVPLYTPLIEQAGLFKGVGAESLAPMLRCLGAEAKDIKKGDIVLLAGDVPTHVGMVLAGRLHIYREDYDGKRTLLAAVTPGELFAEALCCAGVQESPVTVLADEDSRIMQMAFARLLRTCSQACPHHARLIENMLSVIANKNLLLQGRMEVVSLRSVRAKVLRFLEPFAARQGEAFTVPFNRDEMAEFLCVERSALSHELMRMKRDGLIDYRKNRFTLF